MAANGKWMKCENCGEDIYRTEYRQKKNKYHFCSIKCQKEFIHKNSYETRQCEICGKPFEIAKKKPQRFCSTACQHEWQKTQIGCLNKRYTRQKIKCDYCGMDFFEKNYKTLSSQYHFCSIVCRQKWFATVYSQRDEVKQASRERALNMMSSGKFQLMSKPQQIVNKLIESLNLKYENEYVIGAWAFDNYLLDSNLLIEVMGDFWHASPIKYNYDNISARQKERIAKDGAKNNYVSSLGMKILYLWEKDIMNTPELCKKLLIEYVKNNGELDDYNSFNYCLHNEELVLNDIIIYPHFVKIHTKEQHEVNA